MKILLFITPYLNLCQTIVDELIKQGHQVECIEDKKFQNDPKRYITRKRKIKNWNRNVEEWWKSNEYKVAKQFDLFISINGVSINANSLELIKSYSPEIHTVFYAWDSFNYVDFRMVGIYFDQCFTFDIIDAMNSGWTLLPSFYVNNKINKSLKQTYDISFIGSNHDRRYSFVRKIIPFLEANKIKYFIKIFGTPIKKELRLIIKDIVKICLSPNIIHEYLFKYGYENQDLKITTVLNRKEYNDIILKSRCVLEDNRPNQAGLSPRFIQALALNKKIITTNQWAQKFSFVDSRNVLIIDKKTPKINLDFIQKENTSNPSPDLECLNISNWVKILLGEKECPVFTKS